MIIDKNNSKHFSQHGCPYANEPIKLRKQVESNTKKKIKWEGEKNITKQNCFHFFQKKKEGKKLARRKKSILNHSFFMK